MATRHPLSTVGNDEPPDALPEVLIAARNAVEQEFRISERLDTKARGLVTLAGQWFAIAQAVSAVAYSTKHPHDWLVYCVALTAILGGIALGVTFYLSWQVWKVRDEGAVSPKGLTQMKTTAEQGAAAMGLLIQHYASILQDRRKTNKERADALENAQSVWFAAMALPLFQLGFALATRLLA